MRSVSEWRAVLAEVDQAGLCAHPVRLRGVSLDRSTGELAEGALLVPCKDRRAAVCPSCSRLYQADAWQLVAAGIRGGKGVSPDVAGHPQVFVTLTAPSFGPVHRTDPTGVPRPCRPRRSGGRCPHGRPLSCTLRHGSDDPVVGEPLCPECFDYRGAVLWNAHVSRLWGRTCSPPLPRGRPGRRHDRPGAAFGGPALLHQGGRVPGPRARPPPRGAAGRRWGRAVRGTAGVARRRGPDRGHRAGRLRGRCAAFRASKRADCRRARWGAQHDVRVLLARDDADATAIAAYVAKYATKTADGTPWLAHQIRTRAQIERLVLRPHIVAMVKTAWALGGRRNLAPLRLRDHAHTLGYPGQFSSKSVRFSTTFTALRQARSDYVRRDAVGDFDYDGEWRYAGRGYANAESDTLAKTLLDARPERAPQGSTGFPIDFPRRFPMPVTWDDALERNFGWGPIGEPSEERFEEPGLARWRHDRNHQPPAVAHVTMSCGSPAVERPSDLAARIACPSTGANEEPDLLTLLHRRDADGRPAIRILERLATGHQTNRSPHWGSCTCAAPDLEVMSKRLVHSGRVSVLDAEADTLSAAWEVVTRRHPPSRWERLDAMWNEARRASRMRRQRSAEAGPLPEEFDLAALELEWPETPAAPAGRRRGRRCPDAERRGPARADPGRRRTTRRRSPGPWVAPTTPCGWSVGGPRPPCAPLPGATSRRGRDGSGPLRMRSMSAGSRCWPASASHRLSAVRSALASMARAPRSHRPKSSGAPRRPARAAFSAPVKSSASKRSVPSRWAHSATATVMVVRRCSASTHS